MSDTQVMHGTVVVMGYQLRGRGHAERRWHAPWGQSLLISIILTDRRYSELVALSLRCAWAVVHALETRVGTTLQIKWPNDILWRDKKLCGILTEIKPVASIGSVAVIGVGINCLERRFPTALHNSAVSLRQIVGADPALAPVRLLPKLLVSLKNTMPISDWRERVTARLWRRGQEVILTPRGASARRARIVDIDSDGGLVVQEGATLARYYAGEVATERKSAVASIA